MLSDEMTPIDLLIEDLVGLFATTGREVRYVSDEGVEKAYWPRRYLQAVRKAIATDEVVDCVERMVTRDPSPAGFGRVEAAGRLDLTVEALVADEKKPYHHLFSRRAIAAARASLAKAEARVPPSGHQRNSSSTISYK